MKPLNCQCQQCRAMRAKHTLYQTQTRKARRIAKALLRKATQQRQYDIDIPVKARGVYAS